jgi:hypothetical protein
MQTDSTGYSHLLNNPSSGLGASLGQTGAHARGHAQGLRQNPIANEVSPTTSANSSGQAGAGLEGDEARLDQLSFSESVKILSEAMKAQVRQGGRVDASGGIGRLVGEGVSGSPGSAVGETNGEAIGFKGDDGSEASPAGKSLNHLLDALGSALDKAGLEQGNQSALQRILGDIRNSVQYGPRGYAQGADGGGAAKQGVLKGPNPGLLNLSA